MGRVISLGIPSILSNPLRGVKLNRGQVATSYCFTASISCTEFPSRDHVYIDWHLWEWLASFLQSISFTSGSVVQASVWLVVSARSSIIYFVKKVTDEYGR